MEPASLFLSDHGAFTFTEPVSELFILRSHHCHPNSTLPGYFPHSCRIPSSFAVGKAVEIKCARRMYQRLSFCFWEVDFLLIHFLVEPLKVQKMNKRNPQRKLV